MPDEKSHSKNVVRWLIDDFAKAARFPKCIGRAVCFEESPSPELLEYCFDLVAFTNYVPEPLSDRGNRSRLNWQRAREEFTDLLETLKPKRIIVLGKDMWGKMPDADPEHSFDFDEKGDVQAYRLSSGERCYVWALTHPANRRQPLPWRKLASLIYFTCGDVFLRPKRPAA